MPRLFHSRQHSDRGSVYSGNSSTGSPAGSELQHNVDTFQQFDDVSAPPAVEGPRPKATPRANVRLPEPSEDTPREMIPILSLLTAHSARNYHEGYFMMLYDLNNDGQPAPNRQWCEVFGVLTGSVVTCWDTEALDAGIEPPPIYINIMDASFKCLPALPTQHGQLQNIVVISTTMRNRFLLQFSNPKAFSEWSAALRLSQFEYTSLQEAYTGALLSSRGSRLNGIRPLLGETKTKRGDWCNVRIGPGGPYRRMWYVLTPANLLKDRSRKKLGFGQIAFYDNPKAVKKPPLAVMTRAWAAYAVFPERAVLVNHSTLIKAEGLLRYSKEKTEYESQVFLMPEQHAGIQGFETLIRFMIPFLDVFQLYGRPKRLNADKQDMRSLLFAMPTLPCAYYLDVTDLIMLVSLPDSGQWSVREWNLKIKEMLARKLGSGFKGLGNIHEIISRARAQEKAQKLSQYEKANVDGLSLDGLQLSTQRTESRGAEPGTPASESIVAEPTQKSSEIASEFQSDFASSEYSSSFKDEFSQSQFSFGGPSLNNSTTRLQGPGTRDMRALSQPGPFQQGNRPPASSNYANELPLPPVTHERSASEGQDPNNLLLNVATTPNLDQSPRSAHSPYYTPGQQRPGQGRFDNSNTSLVAPVAKRTPNGSNGSLPISGYQPSESPPSSGSSVDRQNAHFSYAEYSEYMRNYLANTIDESNDFQTSTLESAFDEGFGKAKSSDTRRSPPRSPQKVSGPRPMNGSTPSVNSDYRSGAKQVRPVPQRPDPSKYEYKRADPSLYEAQRIAPSPHAQVPSQQQPSYQRGPPRPKQQMNAQPMHGAPSLNPPQNGYRPSPQGSPRQNYPPASNQGPPQAMRQNYPYQSGQNSPRPAYQNHIPAPGTHPHRRPVHEDGRQGSPHQHVDVRQPPPMKPVANPYAQNGGYPAFPQQARKVQGGRPMPGI